MTQQEKRDFRFELKSPHWYWLLAGVDILTSLTIA